MRPLGWLGIARLGLVRTLRDLGIDLPTIRRVLEREVSVPEVAAAHAAARPMARTVVIDISQGSRGLVLAT